MFGSKELDTALKDHLLGRQQLSLQSDINLDHGAPLITGDSTSAFLRISATADYFSSNETLMKDGLLVDFDISALTSRISEL